MNLADIKARINPAYADQRGTESHERKWLCDRIDELTQQRDYLKTHALALEELSRAVADEFSAMKRQRDELLETVK